MNSMQMSAMVRRDAFVDFLAGYFKTRDFELMPMVGDASFRYYSRIKPFEGYIAVDAAPDLANDNKGFVEVANLLAQHGLHAPQVYAADLDQGFLLVSDLGNTVYLQALSPENAEKLYGQALDSLAQLQTLPVDSFAPFGGQRMREELEHFRVWLLQDFIGCQLDPVWQKKLTAIFDELIRQAEKQPQVFIHRDYHSRNLLVCGDKTPGILDFQDAMIGPVTYDAVSLLRDAYIDWPAEQVEAWALSFYDRIRDGKNMRGLSADAYIEAFDFMGMQRHLKAAFIFARKYLRDGVTHYFNDIPRTLNYVIEISQKYPQCNDLHELLRDRVLPYLAQKVNVA